MPHKILTAKDIILHRLHNQQIAALQFKNPHDLVSWMGGMQGQDYNGAKWAIALRLNGYSELDIEKSIAQKEIIRTWPMRTTLHYVAAEDIRWILKLTTPVNIKNTARRYKQLGLDNKKLNKSTNVISKALEGDKQLTRSEIASVLKKAGFTLEENRLSFLIYWAGMQQLICFGEKIGSQVTYTLIDEWVPKTKKAEPSNPLAELAVRYFTSRGPATLKDFAWWSGFNITSVKQALEEAKNKLNSFIFNDIEYWLGKDVPDKPSTIKPVYLLPWFDEYLVSYKDRNIVLDSGYIKKVNAGGGMLNPTVIVNGRVAGTWKREIKKDKVHISVMPLTKFDKPILTKIKTAAEEYGSFLGYKTEVTLS